MLLFMSSNECLSLLLLKREPIVVYSSTKMPDTATLKLFLHKSRIGRRGHTTPATKGATELHVAFGFYPEDEEEVKNTKPRPVLDQPPVTDTVMERIVSPPKPVPPKIIVLGSTGRIGRRIIRQLMSLPSDIKIVAFARNYERACEVLYDELLIEREKKGPTLQLVVMDLVPPCHVAGYKAKDDDDKDENEYAVSASRFYNNDVADYDVPASEKDDAIDLNPYLPLQDAIANATAVISAIGTVRSTIPFADYLFKPWRIFISPGKWCKDKSHPYYVNYMVHKKVLEYCEEAQRKRNREWRIWENHERRRASKNKQDEYTVNENGKADRIRIVRISDHCLANPAWDVVNVITNAVRSLVFRYQEKCEKLLSRSTLVDSIVLRPGDLLDDVRNETTTTMSVNVDGKLPSPVYVGRDDVASLATLLALSDLEPPTKGKKEAIGLNGTTVMSTIVPRAAKLSNRRGNPEEDPRHWNIAVGWTGRNGRGYPNAGKCMEYIVKEHGKRKKSERRKQALRNTSPFYRMVWKPCQKLKQRVEQRSLKPHRIFTFLPMFVLVYPTIFSLVMKMGRQVPAVRNAALYILAVTAPSRKWIIDYILTFIQNFIQQKGIAKQTAADLLIT